MSPTPLSPSQGKSPYPAGMTSHIRSLCISWLLTTSASLGATCKKIAHHLKAKKGLNGASQSIGGWVVNAYNPSLANTMTT